MGRPVGQTIGVGERLFDGLLHSIGNLSALGPTSSFTNVRYRVKR
jgi:hypothetical protein